ncbi:hypothetical protein D3C85_1753480 [compost metagenome]
MGHVLPLVRLAGDLDSVWHDHRPADSLADEARDGPVHRCPGQGSAEFSDHCRDRLGYLLPADAVDYRVLPVWPYRDRCAGADDHRRGEGQ